MLETIALDGGFIELRGRFGKTTSGMKRNQSASSAARKPRSENFRAMIFRDTSSWQLHRFSELEAHS